MSDAFTYRVNSQGANLAGAAPPERGGTHPKPGHYSALRLHLAAKSPIGQQTRSYLQRIVLTSAGPSITPCPGRAVARALRRDNCVTLR